MPKEIFDLRYKDTKVNPRNTASGIVNSKTPTVQEAKDLRFIAYEFVEDSNDPNHSLPQSEQFERLKALGFTIPFWEKWEVEEKEEKKEEKEEKKGKKKKGKATKKVVKGKRKKCEEEDDEEDDEEDEEEDEEEGHVKTRAQVPPHSPFATLLHLLPAGRRKLFTTWMVL